MSCPRTQCSDAGEARTRGPRSRVKYSTTEPLHSLLPDLCILTYYYKQRCGNSQYFDLNIDSELINVSERLLSKTKVAFFQYHISILRNKENMHFVQTLVFAEYKWSTRYL